MKMEQPLIFPKSEFIKTDFDFEAAVRPFEDTPRPFESEAVDLSTLDSLALDDLVINDKAIKPRKIEVPEVVPSTHQEDKVIKPTAEWTRPAPNETRVEESIATKKVQKGENFLSLIQSLEPVRPDETELTGEKNRYQGFCLEFRSNEMIKMTGAIVREFLLL